jgi:hypothetical protein
MVSSAMAISLVLDAPAMQRERKTLILLEGD